MNVDRCWPPFFLINIMGNCFSRGIVIIVIKENLLYFRKPRNTESDHPHGRELMTCIFCQIVAHELPTEILFEDEDLAVLKTSTPTPPFIC